MERNKKSLKKGFFNFILEKKLKNIFGGE